MPVRHAGSQITTKYAVDLHEYEVQESSQDYTSINVREYSSSMSNHVISGCGWVHLGNVCKEERSED